MAARRFQFLTEAWYWATVIGAVAMKYCYYYYCYCYCHYCYCYYCYYYYYYYYCNYY